MSNLDYHVNHGNRDITSNTRCPNKKDFDSVIINF